MAVGNSRRPDDDSTGELLGRQRDDIDDAKEVNYAWCSRCARSFTAPP
jgi:hypothetical protein